MPLMGCFPRYLKATNLINYINRAEIVKNFTNFACGVCERAIKYSRSSNRLGFLNFARGFVVKSPFLEVKKTIDGERFLKRIPVSQWLLFVCRKSTVNEK